MGHRRARVRFALFCGTVGWYGDMQRRGWHGWGTAGRRLGLVLIWTGGVACGHYSFSGVRVPGVASIAIPVFEDQSGEFQIREQLTNRLVERFLTENTLPVVAPDDADSILRGTILRVEDNPVSLRTNETAQQFELYIYVQVRYENQRTHETLFEDRLSGRGTFDEPASRELGIELAIEKLSEDLLNKVISGW